MPFDFGGFDPSYYRMSDIFSPNQDDTESYGGESTLKRKNNTDWMANLYKGPANVEPNQPPPIRPFTPPPEPTAPQESPEDAYMRRFKMMTDTSGPAQEAYKKYIDTMPSRQDYAPGKMRSFAAALVGGAEGYKNPSKGVLAAEGIRDMPYEKAMSDFTAKAKGLQESAQEERQSLTARRALFNDSMLNPSKVAGAEARAAKDTATAKDTEAKTADRPAELDIKRKQAVAKAALEDAIAQYNIAKATGEPALIEAATSNAKAKMLEAQAAGVNAAANTVKAAAATTSAGADVTRAGAAVTAAEAAKERAGKTSGQPVLEEFHTQDDLDKARKAAVKAVITRNNTYSGFGEKDKQGNLTGGTSTYSPSIWSDKTADHNQFLRDVEAETQKQLKLTPRKRKVGTTTPGTTAAPTSSSGRPTGTISDMMNRLAGLPDQ
jgi:hypothetical protein